MPIGDLISGVSFVLLPSLPPSLPLSPSLPPSFYSLNTADTRTPKCCCLGEGYLKVKGQWPLQATMTMEPREPQLHFKRDLVVHV